MAKLGGFIRKFVGSIGNVTFKRVAGQTIASEKIEATSSPTRTYAQMVRRVQWANIINFYRCFNGNLHPSFENKAAKVSDYNEFMSANIGMVPVYLTKDQSRQGGCLVAAYQVTRGSIPSISIGQSSSNTLMTDIALGGLTIGASTTIKEFSDAVINNNENFEHGDQISCFIARQTRDSNTMVPYVKIEALEVTLNQSDATTKLWDVVNAGGFSSVDDKIGASAAVEGGIVWIHSRKSQSGTRVSTQRFYVTNSLLASYQTNAALTEAILSYGGVLSDEFLTPNNTDTAAAAGADDDNP